MDPKDELVQKRESNGMIFIKEEIADNFNDDKYNLNSSFDNEEIKAEPGVIAWCKDEPIDFQEDKKFSFGLVKDDDIDLENLLQDGIHSLTSDTQSKRKMENQRKLNAKGKVTYAQKDKECATKTGRISRDEMFKNKEYFCTLCQKRYLGRKCFRQHFKHHFSVCHSQYICLICEHTSRTVSHINRHILESHFLQDNEAEKLFACTLCEKRFYAKKDLERHIFAHTRKGTLTCGDCDFSCIRKYQLVTHMSLVHGHHKPSKKTARSEVNDSEFICHYCNYSSKEKSALRNHIKRHIGYKSFKCSECNYTCTERGDMEKHSTIHSDDRPFVCSLCRKTFKRKSHLMIHFNGKCICRGAKRKKNSSKKYM